LETQERLEDQDAETRVNAVYSLTAVCEILYGGPAESLSRLKFPLSAPVPHQLLGPVVREQVMDVLLKALDDYAIDNRGDVGSWVREATMDALKRCSFLLFLETNGKCTKVEPGRSPGETERPARGSELSPEEIEATGLTETSGFTRSGPLFDKEIAVKVIGGLAKQGVEKIDRVRDVAGRTLQHLLHCDQLSIDRIPHRRALEQIVPNDTNLNWAVRILTFFSTYFVVEYVSLKPVSVNYTLSENVYYSSYRCMCMTRPYIIMPFAL
jgi:hypothetical protein